MSQKTKRSPSLPLSLAAQHQTETGIREGVCGGETAGKEEAGAHPARAGEVQGMPTGAEAALVLALTPARAGTLEAGTGMAEVMGKGLEEKGKGEVGI